MSVNRSDDIVSISELSVATGVAVSALRYYDELGLVSPIGRHGTRRMYQRDAVDLVALVVAAQQCGFTLKEIGALIESHGSDRRHWRGVLRRKSTELREIARQHERMADMLEHSLECRALDPLTCARFRSGVRDLAVAVSQSGR